MSASPSPDVKVVSASRPDLGCTGTCCVNSVLRYARPFAWSAPLFEFAPYAAMMFHWAEPDVNGFGVTPLMPGRMRSDQVLMCFGLPLRTTIATTELETKPWWACDVQLELTMPALASRSMSG